MSNLKTNINWMLHDHCTSECSYCPTRLRGGPIPKGILDYMAVTTKLIDHYDSLDRKINWTFGGGEPLDMFDFPMMLKLCKERGGNVELTTNGGKLWLDWWAIEPHIDQLHLTYHYWQNPNLIRFIIQAFHKANKHIKVIVPMRPDYFEEDLTRALAIESEFNIIVSKAVLYNEADRAFGMFFYDDRQIGIMLGKESVQERKQDRVITVAERFEKAVYVSPSYTGQLCNLGIERLTISHTGWVRGSNCNTTQFGNIWEHDFALPTSPQRCVMVSCIDGLDQQITKFNQ
jgi:organic radical activating enzyme